MGRVATKIALWILIVLRLAVGGVFIYAGATKIGSPAAFYTDIQAYRILPHLAAWGMAVYLPWLEIFCGLGVVFKLCYRGALLSLLILMIVFTIALASGMARGLDISCGCFGSITDVHYPSKLALNLCLTIVIGVLLKSEERLRARD